MTSIKILGFKTITVIITIKQNDYWILFNLNNMSFLFILNDFTMKID